METFIIKGNEKISKVIKIFNKEGIEENNILEVDLIKKTGLKLFVKGDKTGLIKESDFEKKEIIDITGFTMIIQL